MLERFEGHVEVEPFAARFGFRVVSTTPLVGGPIEVEFVAEALTDRAIHLAIGGDRARARPAWFTFPATYDGVPLSDPSGDVPNLGGPISDVTLHLDKPFRQRLLLNEFVTLEDALASGQLVVLCRRLPYIGWTREETARPVQDPAEVQLSLRLLRDDAALEALVSSLVQKVWNGTRGESDQALRVLTALRAPITVALWEPLAEHPDPQVRERVQSALVALRQP